MQHAWEISSNNHDAGPYVSHGDRARRNLRSPRGSVVIAARGRYAGWPAGVPHSADAAERWFLQQLDAGVRVNGWPKGVPHTPDALDRWYAEHR